MKLAHAKALIEAWRADAQYERLSQDMLDELNATYGFFPYVARVQVMIGNRNQIASNFLWDGKFKEALRALMKYGLRDRVSVINQKTAREGKKGMGRKWFYNKVNK